MITLPLSSIVPIRREPSRFKSIPGFPEYSADVDGNIYSSKFGRFKRLNPGKDSSGYLQVCLCSNGKQHSRQVSHLILETFIGPQPSGEIACHGPLGKENNSISNLSWGTWKKNNGEDKVRDKAFPDATGEKNPAAKLTEEKVKEIRRLSATGVLGYEIGRRFEISPSTVGRIVNRKTWRNL